MSRRTRYQQGSVQREKRQSGPDVWIFRWREVGPDGIGKQRKAIVGTVESLPTEAAALKAAHALRIDANQQTPLAEGGPKTIAELIAHYRLKELAGEKQGRKAFSTRAGYESYLNCWIVPRWGITGSIRSSPSRLKNGWIASSGQMGREQRSEIS